MAVAPTSHEAERLKTRVPINTLSEEDQAALLEKIRVEELKRGEYLFRQGDTDPQNVYLLSGRIDLLLDDRVVDTIADDMETARFALAHQFPRKFSARAKGPVKFVSIDSQLLSGLLTPAHTENSAADADEDWMTQLLRSSVVQHIPPANIQNVMMRMEQVKVKAGDEVVKQGDEGRYFFLINKGRCVVTRRQEGDREAEVVAYLGAGDNFGEEALLSDSPRGCSVTMLTDGILFRLGKEDFTAFIKRPLTKDISYEQAARIVEAGGVWLDVRDPAEHQRNGMEGSINIPLHLLRFQIDGLALDRQYVVYCADGSQSAVAAFLLLERGADVFVLKNGIHAVPGAGKPVLPDGMPEEAVVVQQDDAEEIGRLKQERDEAREQADQLRDELLEKTEKYEQVQRRLVSNIATLKQAVQELQSKLAAAQEQGGGDEALKRRIAQLEHEKAEQSRQIQRLESGQRQLNAEMEILLEASEENDRAGLAEVTRLKEQIADLQQQLNAAKSGQAQ